MTPPLSPPPFDPARRRFLGASAAAAGALSVGCASTGALGQDGRSRPVVSGVAPNSLRPDQPIGVAILGTGGMGGGHLDGLLRMRDEGRENLNVIGLADVCGPRLDRAAAKVAERQPGVACTATKNWRELIARDDLHAVLIATPEHWHAPMAVEAMQAGKDVYVEKPMTRHLVDALWMQQQVEAGTQICQIGTQFMMKTNHEKARELIRSGAIGYPTLSQTSYCRNNRDGEWLYEIEEGVDETNTDWQAWCGTEGEHPFDTEVFHRWRRYRTWSTGILGDLLVHQMTPLIYALDLGAPTRVTASGGHYVDRAMENHDQVFLSVEFGDDRNANGHTMIVAGSTSNDRGLETIVRGHEADLLLGNDAKVVLRPQSPFVDDVDPQEIDCETMDWQDALRADWLDCVRTRKPNRSKVDLGVHHMVAVELATRSLWDGKAYRFDAAEGRIFPA